MSRYQNRNIEAIYKDNEVYGELLKDRKLNKIIYYTTPKFKYPTANEMSNLDILSYEWKLGDRYSKLAYQFYGDATYWWVIAKFNNKPTDANVNIGDVINIPTSLEQILKYMKG